MGLRLTTLALAQFLDFATFRLMIRDVGVAAEGNPFAANLFRTLGMPGVAVAKLALVVLVGALAVIAARHRGVRVWAIAGGLPLALAIAGGIIGGITNTAVVLG